MNIVQYCYTSLSIIDMDENIKTDKDGDVQMDVSMDMTEVGTQVETEL